jgi:predicted phage tail component-like protein
MDSRLRRDEGTYGDITLSMECSFFGDPVSKISAVKGWLLSAGEADLTFSHIPGRKYRAQVVNSIDFEIVLKITSHFVILFNCQPFQYATDNTRIKVSESMTITNPGTVASLPNIKVNGYGPGSLTVNENSVSFGDIDGSVTLDSTIQETYQDIDTELISKNSTKAGDYPMLLPGDNVISFSGGITSLEITPNWRWL